MGRILIADDDAEIRQLLTHLLVEEGHEVAAARDGAAALERINTNPPDMLILDLMMPEVDGYTVLEELQQMGNLGVRTIVVSARGGEADLERSLALGACHHMIKPFDPVELLTEVESFLQLSPEEIRERQEDERDRAHLLSQLESLFDN
jgi:two-component system alkaline phosphatase synthesis response regulator PhoP